MIAEHPVITGVRVGTTLTGAVAGFLWLSPEWSALRRIAAGGVGGFWVAFLIAATRMMGAWR